MCDGDQNLADVIKSLVNFKAIISSKADKEFYIKKVNQIVDLLAQKNTTPLLSVNDLNRVISHPGAVFQLRVQGKNATARVLLQCNEAGVSTAVICGDYCSTQTFEQNATQTLTDKINLELYKILPKLTPKPTSLSWGKLKLEN